MFAVVAFVGPGTASAPANPPAIDQYVEQVPSPGGERPADPNEGPRQGSPGSEATVSPDVVAVTDRPSTTVPELPERETRSVGARDGGDANDRKLPIAKTLGWTTLGGSGVGPLLLVLMLLTLLLGALAFWLARSQGSRGN